MRVPDMCACWRSTIELVQLSTKAILLMDDWRSDLALLGPQLGEGVAAAIEENCVA